MKSQALTDEEWQSFQQVETDGRLILRTRADEVVTSWPRRQAVAALAMFGQDYGVTHQEVDALVAVVNGFQQGDANAAIAENFYVLVGLAGALQTLLPPKAIADSLKR